MKRNSYRTCILPRAGIATATTLLFLTTAGVSHPENHSAKPPDGEEPAEITKKTERNVPKLPASNKAILQAPLEFEIDPERVKRNQEVLNELYRNVYRYDSGVLNYEKKIN